MFFPLLAFLGFGVGPDGAGGFTGGGAGGGEVVREVRDRRIPKAHNSFRNNILTKPAN
jgi:hypothetical protein